MANLVYERHLKSHFLATTKDSIQIPGVDFSLGITTTWRFAKKQSWILISSCELTKFGISISKLQKLSVSGSLKKWLNKQCSYGALIQRQCAEVSLPLLWYWAPWRDHEMMDRSDHQPERNGTHVHTSASTWTFRCLRPSTSDRIVPYEYSPGSWYNSRIMRAPIRITTFLQGSVYQSARRWQKWIIGGPLSWVPNIWLVPGRGLFGLVESAILFILQMRPSQLFSTAQSQQIRLGGPFQVLNSNWNCSMWPSCNPSVRVPTARPVLEKKESVIFRVLESCLSQRHRSWQVSSYWSGLMRALPDRKTGWVRPPNRSHFSTSSQSEMIDQSLDSYDSTFEGEPTLPSMG